jgi:hypothetical protein
VSHTVSSALKLLGEELNKPAYLTTAWFLDQVERCCFMELFRNMAIGYKKLWKPSQTGVLISTQSMLNVQANLLENKSYKFILTSRFSQNSLENLFSSLRAKQIVPNAVQVKNNLKLICVSQYIKNTSTSSYEEDDRQFLAGFLDIITDYKVEYDQVQLPAEVREVTVNLRFSELHSLYNIAGYLLRSIKNTTKTCSQCVNSAGSTTPIYTQLLA